MSLEMGKEIYHEKKVRFDQTGRNTESWNEDIRGSHFRKIVNYFDSDIIPYSCFCDSKQLCGQIFNSKNDWNYIYYTIFMALDLGRLKETDAGLLCIGS